MAASSPRSKPTTRSPAPNSTSTSAGWKNKNKPSQNKSICSRNALLRGMLLGNAGLQLHSSTFDAHGVFHFLAALVLKFFRLLADEALKILQAGRPGFFPRFRSSFDQPFIKLLHFFIFALRIGERRRKSFRRFSLRHGNCTFHGSNDRRVGCGLARSLRLNRFRRRAEMALLAAGFFLHGLLAPHVHVLRVRLRKIVVAKSLRETQLARTFVITPQKRFHSPLRVRRGARTPAAEILFILDLQRPNVAFDLV